SQMMKSGKKVNFHTVAEAAGVSVAYLYKQESLRERIDRLRNQNSAIIGIPLNQGASDESKKSIATTLKERLRKLEAENRGLREHIEVIQGIALEVTNLRQQLEVLRKDKAKIETENQRLLQELELEIGSLKTENGSLKEQLYECHSSRQVSTSFTLPIDAKVTSLDKKRIQGKDISDKIKLELDSVGVKINTTLTKAIKSTSEEIVLSAIQALREALKLGSIERPGGWLNRAIQDGWMPNENNLPQDKVERDIFKQWFDLAYKQRLVLASTKDSDGRMYVFTVDGVRLSFDQMLAEYPLEKLKPSLSKI
ncbi:DUF6262 family protein, partial [Aetokthonos hydrillicola]